MCIERAHPAHMEARLPQDSFIGRE